MRLFFEKLRNRLFGGLSESHPLVPVVRLTGTIAASTGSLRQDLNIANVTQALDRAFSVRSAAAVAIVINSPGGAPVQSHLIYKRIRDLAEKKEKPVYVFVEDVAASGGYMIALAGDEIIADPSSIVGSIGVIFAGFGLDRLIEKAGIDRRVHTAGERKMILDPFRPEQPEDVRRLKALQKDMHRHFIDLVKTRRGDNLNGSDKLLFSGEFWTGEKAAGLGLIDGIGELRQTMRERFGEKVRLVPVARRRGGLFGGRLFSRGEQTPADLTGDLADRLIAAVEARLSWARFGL